MTAAQLSHLARCGVPRIKRVLGMHAAATRESIHAE
jgi:hypothetical protein